jgi:hypothetical protein
MSLQTDIIFFEALSADTELMTTIGNRLYNTSIPVPDEQFLNAPVPYIIITFDGLNNQDTTKDDPYEGGTDKVSIGIEVAASTREVLGNLTESIRNIIHDDFMFVWGYQDLQEATGMQLEDSNDFKLRVMREYDEVVAKIPQDYTFTADAVQYDSRRPCYWQVLHFQCSMNSGLRL